MISNEPEIGVIYLAIQNDKHSTVEWGKKYEKLKQGKTKKLEHHLQ